MSSSMSRRRGQVTTYLKPILVMLFMVMAVFMFMDVMTFQTDLEQDRSEIQFQQEVRRDMQQLVDCLRVNDKFSGSSYVLNASKLAEYERLYRLREPPCAENMQYGYDVTVEETYLPELRVPEQTGGPADVVFAIDDSASMGGEMEAVKENVREFMEDMPAGSRVGMFTFASPCITSSEFEGWQPSENHPDKETDEIDETECHFDNKVQLGQNPGRVEEELDPLGTSGGSEPVDGAMAFAREEFDWTGQRRILALITDEPKSSDSYTELTGDAEAEVCAEQGIEVHAIAETEDGFEELADVSEMHEFYDIEDDFVSILDEISRGAPEGGLGDTTCVVPKAGDRGFDVQLALTVDATEGMDGELNQIQQRVPRLMGNLGEGSQLAGIAYQDSVVERQPFTSSAWDMEQFFNNLSTAGQPPGDTVEALNETLQLGWREGDTEDIRTNKAILLVNQNGSYSQNKSCSQALPRLADEAAENNITIYTAGRFAEQSPCKQEIRNTLPQRTGGVFYPLNQSWSTIIQEIRERELKAPTMTGTQVMCEPSYSFGEMEGSDGEGLRKDIELRFPVTIWRSKDLQNPGELVIQVRDGGLERLAGAINSVVRQGNEQNRQIERRVRINNRQELHGGRQTVERPKDTTYQLVNAETGSTEISVTRDLMIGVNGHIVIRDDDGQSSTIDFSDPENQFTAHKGASIQVVVSDLAGNVSIDPLALQCVDDCTGQQEIPVRSADEWVNGSDDGNGDGDDGDDGDGDGDDGDGDGNDTEDDDTDDPEAGDMFMYGFEDIEIGGVDESEEAAVCAATTRDDSCVVVRSDQVSDFRLAPGTHLLRLAYDPATDAVTVRE